MSKVGCKIDIDVRKYLPFRRFERTIQRLSTTQPLVAVQILDVLVFLSKFLCYFSCSISRAIFCDYDLKRRRYFVQGLGYLPDGLFQPL